MCWIFHKWTKWVTTHEGNIVKSNDGGVVGKIIYQERQCENCGKKEISHQRKTIYDWC